MKKRAEIIIKGIVQGVGYRPFVYNLALSFGVSGFVRNNNEGVRVEGEGEAGRVEKFVRTLKAKYPPMAKVESVSVSYIRPSGTKGFYIKESSTKENKTALVSSDLTTCSWCLKDLKDSRRKDYAFTTCTDCGPRFSIVFCTPFDRERTSMKKFKMCKKCSAEYADPKDRRFHAETISCPVCGPKITLYKGSEAIKTADPLAAAVELIKRGGIVAVKGLGGFHLVCDATNERATREMRDAKGREKKPFAIMCRDIGTVKKICEVNPEELKLLCSPENPIVLLKKKNKPGIRIAEEVAPKNKYLGVMLPYTPLHHLIMEQGLKAIVATSANISEEPICSTRQEVQRKLSGITKHILDHDRDIHSRIDDSVARIVEGKPLILRRARGYVPLPIQVRPSKQDILAVGAELKNTFTLVKDGRAFISQHIGDIKTAAAFDHFKATITQFERLFGIKPTVIASDMHPLYRSRRYEVKGMRYEVQHHHAHIASCMAENGLNEKVIGVALDGMGMGGDKTLWGAEFLVADYKSSRRFAHLKYMSLPGGDKASEEPWRMAVSYLKDAFPGKLPRLHGIDQRDIAIVSSMIDKKLNSPMISSMGRLFDAVSAILGICHKNTYEGEAAAELEYAIDKPVGGSYAFDIAKEDDLYVIRPEKMIRQILKAVSGKRPALPAGREAVSGISAKFHNTVAMMVLDICKKARNETKLNKVCLSGGCFQNKYLAEKAIKLLKEAKFKVYTHSLVPTNDGGISLGQAVIAAASLV